MFTGNIDYCYARDPTYSRPFSSALDPIPSPNSGIFLYSYSPLSWITLDHFPSGSFLSTYELALNYSLC